MRWKKVTKKCSNLYSITKKQLGDNYRTYRKDVEKAMLWESDVTNILWRDTTSEQLKVDVKIRNKNRFIMKRIEDTVRLLLINGTLVDCSIWPV